MLIDTCYNDVIGLARATLVSQELSADVGCEGIWTDTVQGASQRANTDSVYTAVGPLLC
jgi:hypothetical protein